MAGHRGWTRSWDNSGTSTPINSLPFPVFSLGGVGAGSNGTTFIRALFEAYFSIHVPDVGTGVPPAWWTSIGVQFCGYVFEGFVDPLIDPAATDERIVLTGTMLPQAMLREAGPAGAQLGYSVRWQTQGIVVTEGMRKASNSSATQSFRVGAVTMGTGYGLLAPHATSYTYDIGFYARALWQYPP